MSELRTVQRPTSVRATVSEQEWLAFRQVALALGVSSSELLGELIRQALREETRK